MSVEMAENVNYNSHGYAASGERFSTSSCSTSTSTSFEWVPTALRRPLVRFGGMAIGFGGLSRQNRADVVTRQADIEDTGAGDGAGVAAGPSGVLWRDPRSPVP